MLKTEKKKKGYVAVSLSKNGKVKSHLIHRLVAQAFIANPENKPIVNHLDENTSNNNVENLSWVTNEENLNYSRVHEKHRKIQPPYEAQIIKLYTSGLAVNKIKKITGFKQLAITNTLKRAGIYKTKGNQYENHRNA